MLRRLPIVAVFAVIGCGGAASDDVVQAPFVDADPEDLVPVEEGKADGWAFTPSDLMDDHVFEDAGFMTVEEVQAFLDDTPYGRKSFLADHRVSGGSVAGSVVASAKEHRINPLVLLAKLQVEMALVGMADKPSSRRTDFAMGCGCPDNMRCYETWRGLGKQIGCAAERFRSYLDDLDEKGRTVAGWSVGIAKSSLDPQSVTPKNRATAALYTYTPWVLHGTGGNWLFWNVFRKYARHFLEARPNHRWVGAACSDVDACGFPDARCDHDELGGACTVECDRYCPDSRMPGAVTTFCWQARCVSRCDVVQFSDHGGCPAGFACELVDRHNDPTTQRRACVPQTR